MFCRYTSQADNVCMPLNGITPKITKDVCIPKGIRIFLQFFIGYWATVCKTVRPMLSGRCLSCLSVCDVRALWPNGWTDQDETWHAGRPRPWPHCVRWGLSSPSPKGAQPPTNFRPISVVAKWLHGSRRHLVWR